MAVSCVLVELVEPFTDAQSPYLFDILWSLTLYFCVLDNLDSFRVVLLQNTVPGCDQTCRAMDGPRHFAPRHLPCLAMACRTLQEAPFVWMHGDGEVIFAWRFWLADAFCWGDWFLKKTKKLEGKWETFWGSLMNFRRGCQQLGMWHTTVLHVIYYVNVCYSSIMRYIV